MRAWPLTTSVRLRVSSTCMLALSPQQRGMAPTVMAAPYVLHMCCASGAPAP